MDYSLLKFIATEQDSLDFLEKYSLLNCLAEKEIEELYFNFDCGDLIIRYLRKYYNKNKRVYQNILLDLIRYFKKSQVSDRRELREFFVCIFPFTSKHIQGEIFQLLSRSENLIENRRAVKLSSILGNDNGYAVAIQLFEKWRDRYMRQDIITYFPAVYILDNLRLIWLNEILNILNKMIIEKLPIENGYVKTYYLKEDVKMYLIYLLKSNCDLLQVQERYLEIEKEERKYIKWVVGQSVNKILLIRLIEMDRQGIIPLSV